MIDRICQSSHIASADVFSQRDKILLQRANFKRSVGLPLGHALTKLTSVYLIIVIVLFCFVLKLKELKIALVIKCIVVIASAPLSVSVYKLFFMV